MARVSMALGLLPLLLGACAGPGMPPAAEGVSGLDVAPAAGPGGSAWPPAAGSVAWPPVVACADLAGALAGMPPEAVRALDPAASPLAMVTDAGENGSIRADLPIPQVAPTHAGLGRCAIVVGTAVPVAAPGARVLDRRQVHSAYPTGTKRRRNPEHQRLEQALAAARREAGDEGDVLRTGDPFLDLIGIVAGGIIDGIGAVSSRREIRSIEAALEATPAFIEEPILTPYRHEVVEIEAERGAVLPVALHDRRHALTWRTAVTLTERRRFAVADGRHAGDAQPQAEDGLAFATSAELARWQAGTPPVATSMILAHLAAAARANEPEAASLEATIARLQAPGPRSLRAAIAAADDPSSAPPLPATAQDLAPTAGQPAHVASAEDAEPAAGPPQRLAAAPVSQAATIAAAPALELLEVGDGAAFGFYVTTEHVVLPAAALGRSSLIAVRYPDGMRAHGLVEIVDERLGLALAYLPRRGEPLSRNPLVAGRPPGSGNPGMPWLVDGAIGGVFVADPLTAPPRLVDAAALDRLVDRLAAL